MKRSLLSLLLILSLTCSARAGDVHAEDDAFWAAAAALLPGFDGQPSEPEASNLDGQWSSVIQWPHVPVSAAALPDGKLLTFSGQERRTWPGTSHQTYWGIYDPETGQFSDDSLYLDHEMFCAHLVMRADGTLQTNGGRYTIEHSSVYDWKSSEWSRVGDLNDRRWYTTSVALADGDVFTVSGSGGPNTAEKFDTTTNSWNRLTGINWQPVANAAGFESDWWPYLFVSPEGKLFHFGPTDTMHWVDPNGNGLRESAGLSVPGSYYPKHAGVAMYESGKILVAGGAANNNGGSSNLCYTVDLNTSPPTVEVVAPMKHARRFSSAVMLPSGEVMIVGGNTSGIKFSDQGAVLTPEIWNPKTGAWREVADMSVPRTYHSVGVLLADGTVFAGGGGYGTGELGDRTHQDGQIYTPANLFDESGNPLSRPEITASPEHATVGSVFEVSATENISKFSAIRLIATTHGWSTDLRYLTLPFSEVSPGKYQIIGHPNPHVMIPGYWMIFGLDEDGVHSESKIVHFRPNSNDNLTPGVNGLNAEYFDDRFGEKKFERVDAAVNFYWSASSSPDASLLGTSDYSARWTGWVVPEESGTYTFYTNSDDGVRLDVDGERLVDAWVGQAPTEYSGTIDLVAGTPTPIKLEWFQGGGPCTIELRWSGPGISKEIIPSRNLLATLESSDPVTTNETLLGVSGRHEMFVDGKLIAIGSDSRETYSRELPEVSEATVAIKAIDLDGQHFIAGVFNIDGVRYVTDASWKVSTVFEEGWEQPGFDDSAWADATDVGGLPVELTGMPKDSLARIIWVADGSQQTVYARRKLGGLELKGPRDTALYVGVPYELQYEAVNAGPSDSDSKVREESVLVDFEFTEGSGALVTDTSGRGNNGVIKERDDNGNAIALSTDYWNSDGFIGSSLEMDGMEFNSNSILEIPSSPSLSALTDQITVMAWVNRNTGSVIPQNGRIPNVAVFAHDYSSFFFGYHNSQYKLEFNTDDGSTASSYTGQYNPGEWEHLVGTYDGSISRLYVNGQQIASDAVTGDLLINTQNNVYSSFTVSGFYDKRNAPVVGYGNRSGITDELDGSIDNFKLYNVALTAGEIQQIYESERAWAESPVDPQPNRSLTFNATGLPASLTMDAETGLITGTPVMSDIGAYTVTVSVSDGVSTAQRTHNWTIAEQAGIGVSFDGGLDGFEYRDDLFLGTNNPSYASGSWQPDAGVSGGGLLVTLGGLNSSNILDMSGGFRGSLELLADRVVRVSFDYNLTMAEEYESDENSQLLFSVDGVLVGSTPDTGYVDQILDTPDDDADTTTGWKTFAADVGPLAAGVHTFEFGAFNNKKTEEAEVTYARFDNITVDVLPPPNEAPVVTTVQDTGNTVGDTVNLAVVASDPEGETLSYSAFGLPTGLSMDLDSGLISGIPAQLGDFDTTITVGDSAGNFSSIEFQWTINDEISLSPVPSAPIESGSSSSFRMAASGGTNPSYKWNFGDGTPDTAPSSVPEAEYTYQTPGRYLVSFTAIDASGREVTTQFYQNVRPQLSVGKPVNSQTIAYDNIGGPTDRVWMVNPDNNTVSVFDATSFEKIVEIPVGGKPRSIAMLPDGRAWVANKASYSISEITTNFEVSRTISLPYASQPHGLVLNSDGSNAYVALEGLGVVLKLRVLDGSVIDSIDLGLHVRGLALDGSGENLYVSRFISPPAEGEDTLTPDVSEAGGEVLLVSTSDMVLEDTIRLQNSFQPDSGGGSRGIPNYLGAIALSPTGLEAWVPSKQDNIERGLLRDGNDLTHDSALRAITSRIDLLTGLEDYQSRVDHDDASVPSAAVYGPNGLYVFVALEASREVAVIDTFGQQELFRFPAERAPQGLCLSPDGKTLYVQNFMSRSMTVHDVAALVEQGVATSNLFTSTASVANEELEPEVLLGKQLFYDAFDDRLSRSDYISCASCHNDGGQDGRVWDLSGFGEGIRNTIDLRGRSGDGHGMLHWSANFDEVQDFETQIRSLSEGTGLIEGGVPNDPLGAPNSGRSADLDALAAYLFSLEEIDASPHRTPEGELTEDGEAGREVFIAHNCVACHAGENFSDSDLGGFHNVGTLTFASGARLDGPLTGIDTPTLQGLWSTPPYLHDGSAATLEEAVLAHAGVDIDPSDIALLVSYLQQVGGDGEVAPEPNTPSIQNFDALPVVIDQGNSTVLSWQIDNGGSDLLSLQIDGGVGDVLGQNSVTVGPLATRTYTITATNLIGSVTAQVTVGVNPPAPEKPSIDSFSADTTTIDEGGSVTLNWSVDDGGTALSALNISGSIGDVLGSDEITVSPVATVTYVLTATNEAGSTTAEVTVEVVPVPAVKPVILNFLSDKSSVQEGESVTLSWSVSDEGYPLTGLSIDQGVGDVLGTTEITITPATSATYTLSATNEGGTVTTTHSVTVESDPVAEVVRIQAEDFDEGGAGISYVDTTPENLGFVYTGLSYRDTQVDIEASLDADGTPNVGWIEGGEWLEYTTNLSDGTYDFTFRVASGSGNPGSVELFVNGSSRGVLDIPSTNGWYAWESHSIRGVELSDSSNDVIRLVFSGDFFNLNWFEATPASGGDGQSPYAAATLPGRIEAEFFDIGGEGIAFHDTDIANFGGALRDGGVDIEETTDLPSGHSVGWFRDSEWLEYTVDVAPGDYMLRARIASGHPSPGSLRVLLDGNEVAELATQSTGSWYNWISIDSDTLSISATGTTVLRLEAVGGEFDLNWIEFVDPEEVEEPIGQTPYGGSPVPLASRIQAEDFDIGGEGESFSDRDVANNGGYYRFDGPDIEISEDEDGSYSLGWFGENEWTEYTVDATPGTYTLRVRVASGYPETGGLKVRIGDRLLIGFIVQNTGGWKEWVTLTASGIQITETGTQVIRVETTGDGANLNWFEFVAE